MQNLKVISGYADGRIQPGKPVTKAQAAMMNRSLKLDTRDIVNPGFSDLPSTHPAYKDVAALVHADVIPKASAFRPNEVLKRGEVAKYLANAYKLKVPNLVKSKLDQLTCFLQVKRKLQMV